MTRDRHRQIEEIFQDLIDLPVGERRAALENRCGHDEALRREVSELLEHYEAARPEFLQDPVFARGASDEEVPLSVGPYSVVAQLGKGGMGVIYEAEQAHPKRRIAVKVLRAALYSQSQLSRFRAEWDALGRLNHPGIASVFEAGLGEVTFPERPPVQLPYIAMEFIEGRALLEHAEHENLDRASRMKLLARVCDAVHYAHEQSVIHRDLKPSNIVVDATGCPRILDFGVARITDGEHTRHTRTGDVIGTVRYMSPEQLLGSRDVDARSDIYSLGVLLFELLTGKSPHGDSDTSITSRILDYERGLVPRIAQHDPTLRGDIDAIVRMAMAFDPANRYRSAAELANDIRRSLLGQPVRAPAENRRDAWRRFARRRRGFISAALTVVVVAALAVQFLEPLGRQFAPTRGIAAGDRLAVMYYENLAAKDDPDRRGEIITELLISGLSQSERLNVVSSQRLHDLLELMDTDVTSIGRTMATKLAHRAGARWLMHGSLLQSEPSLVVKSDIVDMESGDVAATVRTEGEPGESIFSVVDRMTAELLKLFALPRDEMGTAVATSTRSEEAYRHYLEGKAYYRRQLTQEARESFREALRVDSTFAIAAFELARRLRVRQDPTAGDYYALARRHAHRASWRNQQYIEEGFGASAAGRAAKTILERYPRDTDALQILAFVADGNERITYGERLIEVDPRCEPGYYLLAYAYSYDGNLDRALWACDEYEALAPNEPNVFDTRGEIYAEHGQLDEAIAQYNRTVSIKPDFADYSASRKLGRLYMFQGEFGRAEEQFRSLLGSPDPVVRARGRTSLVELLAYRGQIAQALRENSASISVDRMDALDFWQAEVTRLRLAALLLAEIGETEAALESLTESYANGDPGTIGSLARLTLLARIGARDVVEQYWREFEARVAEKDDIPPERLNEPKGHREIMVGAFNQATEYLERATPRAWNQFALARSYLALERWDDVVRVLEPMSVDFRGAYLVEPVDSARLHYHLGVAYDELGREEDAIGQLEKFLSIWEDADPRLLGIEDARRRLAVLRSAD